MVLLTLDIIDLVFSSNVKDVSTIRRKYFCDETSSTALLFKRIGGYTTFFNLRVKITSCACLDGSGLKLAFYWKTHCVILSKSSENCLAAAFGSFVIVNKEVSSAKGFGFD